MAAGLLRRRQPKEESEAVSSRLRAAYESLSAANRAARNDPSAAGARQSALGAASLVPMEMAATATTALATMDELKTVASKHLLSDLGVAAVVAQACVRAAAYSVRVNAAELAGPDRGGQLMVLTDHLIVRAGELCASIEAYVAGALK